MATASIISRPNTTTNWLDIMPATSLARGVPVLHFMTARSYVTLHASAGCWVLHDGGRASAPIPEGMLRVDLSDPQGFAYALRCCCASPQGYSLLGETLAGGDNATMMQIRDAFDRIDLLARGARTDSYGDPFDGPTDADRLALARALAEVVA